MTLIGRRNVELDGKLKWASSGRHADLGAATRADASHPTAVQLRNEEQLIGGGGDAGGRTEQVAQGHRLEHHKLITWRI